MRERSEVQQQALLLLSKQQWLAGHNGVMDSIHLATSIGARTLGVQRCSVWLYNDDKSAIKCVDLYDAGSGEHTSGTVLKARDFPHYFDALHKERIIDAGDAYTNNYTYEFSDVYLRPLGISSMLDAPIWLAGQSIGVLCSEHVGTHRNWEVDEKNFAASLADFVSTAYELADHKKTSDELRLHKNHLESLVNDRTRELQEKNRELETFTYSISHDLRAPLRHAMSYLNILEDDYAEALDDTGQDIIKRAINSLKKMTTMIDSMLGLSRIATHKLKRTETDLSLSLREIASQLVPPDRQLELLIHDTDQASCDIGLLRIALTNLLENALKYTRKTPSAVIEFGSFRENGKVIYFMKDNGCGFDMAHAGKIFNLFERLHTEEEYPGTGIGLSTVERIIRKHGGDIRVKSEVGIGSTFYFTLV